MAPPTLDTIEINSEFTRALELLENSGKNLFITGKAGTGKSTLLEYFRENTNKNVAVLAPTGVAALNVQGQTIHSFFHFPSHITTEGVKRGFSKKLQNILKKLDILIIDEVSMVRADLLDCIDTALRRYLNKQKQFGGLRIVFIGDLYQLPPVVASKEDRELFKTVYKSPWFFDAHVFNNVEMELVELEKVYRQQDDRFIKLLNKIRNKSVEQSDMDMLNTHVDYDFEPKGDFFITLTPTNAAADEINSRKLVELKTKKYGYEGIVTGEFVLKHVPSPLNLEIKKGAQIMMTANDSNGHWVNGSVGKITTVRKAEYDDKNGAFEVKLSNGKNITVDLHTWELSRYFFNKESGKLDAEIIGTFTQYPMRLAWAVTIHKSQGKTFEKVVVDIGRGAFAHGQVYVALSRCTGLKGLVLKKPIKKNHLFMDYDIVRFLTRFQYDQSEEDMPLEQKIRRIKQAIKQKTTLNIVYLKANDTKSKRVIEPFTVGKMEYAGKPFTGVEAYCHKRQEDRVFRVDRILEIK